MNNYEIYKENLLKYIEIHGNCYYNIELIDFLLIGTNSKNVEYQTIKNILRELLKEKKVEFYQIDNKYKIRRLNNETNR